MSYNQETVLPLVDQASTICDMLNAVGHKSQVVGGALRVLALGGTTGDVDIAVLVYGFNDLENLSTRLRTSIKIAGYNFVLQHSTGGYAGNDGFLADWRSGDINIIAYTTEVYTDFKQLIDKFDMNINQWYYNDAGMLANAHYSHVNRKVKVNPLRDNCTRLGRLDARVARFKADLPHLDWTCADETLAIIKRGDEAMEALLL